MPSASGSTRPGNYYDRLTELDGLLLAHDDPVIKYAPSDVKAKGKDSRKLLVCHDYKGGYQEDRTDFSYTFNFWSYCDTFIYFSHHRVTIPPAGWINAAHRQGAKMLGTLIFEHTEGEEDCLRLLLGPLPSSSTSATQRPPSIASLSISPFYARALAAIARQRGFEGYLLNFECPLRGGPDQARSLCAWIEMFKNELKAAIGENAMLLWYDSVVITGQVRWQDRLNHFNLPFFVPSTGFFTNYTWPPSHPTTMSRFFSSLPPSTKASKTLSDIYVGIDVWGRNQHGGGMLNCHRALSHVYAAPSAPAASCNEASQQYEYSIALFGPAWSWESILPSYNMSWDTWFRFDTKFFLGEPSTSDSNIPSIPDHIGLPPIDPLKPPPPCVCDILPYTPLKTFFSSRPRPPPDPAQISFYTSFSPGVGRGWFVEGRRVDQADHIGSEGQKKGEGWTDVDKQTSLGDLLWPNPEILCEDVDMSELWRCQGAVWMDDAWCGGSSLKLDFATSSASDTDGQAAEKLEEEEEETFWSLRIPIQSLTSTPGQAYEASLVYKLLPQGAREGEEPGSGTVDVDIALDIRSSPPQDAPDGGDRADDDYALNPIPENDDHPAVDRKGWQKSRIQFQAPKSQSSERGARISHFSMLLSVLTPPSSPLSSHSFSILLGQLVVYPSSLLPSTTPTPVPAILWVDFTPYSTITSPNSTPSSSSDSGLSGQLKWSTAHVHPSPFTTLDLTKPADNPSLAWPTIASEATREKFMYFNIYTEVLEDPRDASHQQQQQQQSQLQLEDIEGRRRWIGTSGVDGNFDEFELGQGIVKKGSKTRFWVQGVTDRGDVMKFGTSGCSYIDVGL